MDAAYKEALAEAIHEVADLVVNWGGYAEEEEESERRSSLRDKIEAALHATVKAEIA